MQQYTKHLCPKCSTEHYVEVSPITVDPFQGGLLYLAAPWTKIENKENWRQALQLITTHLIVSHEIPVYCPLLYSKSLNLADNVPLWTALEESMVPACVMLACIGKYSKRCDSKGLQREVALAQHNRIYMRFYDYCIDEPRIALVTRIAKDYHQMVLQKKETKGENL